MKQITAWILLVVASLGLVGAPTVYADANNFTFTSLDADYYLGSDTEGRSTLKTVETLTAQFPDTDQNHGIERAIPRVYDGHPTSLSIESVTNQAGNPIPYERDNQNDNVVLRIGDADSYVHGTTVYKITYTQRDVTKYYANTGMNEFYWDINGTQWKQPFTTVSARVHLSDSVIRTFTKDIQCYKGAQGSTNTCTIAANGSVITASASNLSPGETMTVALGFTPGTWRGYEPSLMDKIVQLWQVSLVVTSVIAIGVIVWLVVAFQRFSKRRSELGTIVPEYIPPHDASVLVSAHVAEGVKNEITAQLIDLAVRHYIKIYQTAEKSTFKAAQYELEIIKDTATLTSEEQLFIATIFGSRDIGTKLKMSSLEDDYGMAKKLKQNAEGLKKEIRGTYALEEQDNRGRHWFKRWAIGLAIVSILTVSPLLCIAAIIALISMVTLYRLTDKGLALERYMEGLKMYISVAETERLKMLQSPEGAEKVGAKIDGESVQLVKLYERVLPYAVLFGQEKEWNKQLGVHYAQADVQPDWYVGQAAFNAAVFSSALTDFTGTLNSYTAPISSSTGGSAGGGSAGGGGGGGGGGGW